jgi:hypothetical protein
MIGDRLKMNDYRNIDQQTPGVITPYTINTETGALGQELKKPFTQGCGKRRLRAKWRG